MADHGQPYRSVSRTMTTLPSKLKRAAAMPPFEAPPKKLRQYSVTTLDSSMRLVRRTPSGKSIPVEKCLDIPSSGDDEDEDDVFEDAHEHFAGDVAHGGNDESSSNSNTPNNKAANLHDEQESVIEASGKPDAGSEEGSAPDGEDLFASTFGSKAGQSDLDQADDEIIEISSSSKVKQHVPPGYGLTASEHTQGCDRTRSASTPPPPSRQSTKHEKKESPASSTKVPISTGPREAGLVKDQSPALNFHRKFHFQCKPLQPRLALAPHRYWIGVLHRDRKPKNAKEEKHFTWMKGNRLTTIETVWHTYSTTTFTDDFVLLLGRERVEMKDRAEELDYFNDHFICLRAVDEKSEEAKGRLLGEGCPAPEPIEIEPGVIEID